MDVQLMVWRQKYTSAPLTSKRLETQNVFIKIFTFLPKRSPRPIADVKNFLNNEINMPNHIDKTDFKYVYFLISNKINKNTMYIQINNFNKSDIGKQQFQKTWRKSEHVFLETNSKPCEIDNNDQPTNPCVWYSVRLLSEFVIGRPAFHHR